MQKLIHKAAGDSNDVTSDKVIMLSLRPNYICQLRTYVQSKSILYEQKGSHEVGKEMGLQYLNVCTCAFYSVSILLCHDIYLN